MLHEWYSKEAVLIDGCEMFESTSKYRVAPTSGQKVGSIERTGAGQAVVVSGSIPAGVCFVQLRTGSHVRVKAVRIVR